jgi:hypothetical protein
MSIVTQNRIQTLMMDDSIMVPNSENRILLWITTPNDALSKEPSVKKQTREYFNTLLK